MASKTIIEESHSMKKKKASSEKMVSPVHTGFIGAVKLYFQNYFNFKGRSTRSEFWYVVLLDLIVTIVLGWTEKEGSFQIGTCLWSLLTLIPMMSLCFRRLHDTGRKGALAIITGVLAVSVSIMATGSISFTHMASDPSYTAGEIAYMAALAALALVTLGFLIYTIVILCKPGQKKENNYGRAPHK